MGALMVSSEGACAAYYQYGDPDRMRRRRGRLNERALAKPVVKQAPMPGHARVSVPTVTLAHGSGGKAMRDLIDDVFVGAFDNPALALLETRPA